MKLYLVRHGDYVPEGRGELSQEGKDDISHLAAALDRFNIHVAAIYHSGKVRAEQTAEILSGTVKCDRPIEYHHGLNPTDDVNIIAEVLDAWAEDVMLVGHLPFMGRLVAKLLTGNENREIVSFQTGSFACLEKIETQRWLLHCLISPNLLK